MFKGILKNFNVFVEGVGYAGVASEYTPPEINITTTDHRGAGMDAPVPIDMGMEGLEATFKFSGYVPEVMNRIRSDQDTNFKVRGGLKDDADEVVKELVHELVGKVVGANFGTWIVGEAAENTLVARLHFFSSTYDGTEQDYIDVKNMIRRVNGVDQLESLRQAIGR